MKKVIIAATYGSNNTDVFNRAVFPFVDMLAECFPDYDIRLAYTGKRAREMMKKRGMCADSVEEVLHDLAEKGYDEVAIQPSHIIGGDEFNSIKRVTDTFSGLFDRIDIGAPLLNSSEDIKTVCRLLHDEMQKVDNEIVLMGHGTNHAANHIYQDFDSICKDMGYIHMHVATLESEPSLTELLPVLHDCGRKKITLAPLLFSAGSHACRDMAGESAQSWKSVLIANGFNVTAVLKGLGEYVAVRKLYVSHLTDALAPKL